MTELADLPRDLPIPVDDGGADHLAGMTLPSIALPATSGRPIDMSEHSSDWLVLYVYPMTGRPDRELPDGWEMIPGARGCTPQSCAFRDHHEALAELGASVVGLSVQDTEYQREMVERLHLPYPVVSDHDRIFGAAMELPTMSVSLTGADQTATDEVVLYKRLTLIVRSGVIEHVMYPVFPPDQNAGDVEAWLKTRSAAVDK